MGELHKSAPACYGRGALRRALLLFTVSQLFVNACFGWGFTIYENANYRGRFYSVSASLINVGVCVDLKGFNDLASSVQFNAAELSGALEVSFYQDYGCSKLSNTYLNFNAPQASLASALNDKWSSYQIVYKAPIFKFYRDQSFGSGGTGTGATYTPSPNIVSGACVAVSDTSAAKEWSFSDRTTVYDIYALPPNAVLTFYDSDFCTGTSLDATSNPQLQSFASISCSNPLTDPRCQFNDKLSSFRITF